MTVAYNHLSRLKPIVFTVWPVCAFAALATLAIARGLPPGYVRAAVALPIILLVPGALTVCAIFGQRRRPTGTVFAGYVVLLSLAWMAFASLGLYMLHILITAISTYFALLVVSGILTVVAEGRLLSERRTNRCFLSQGAQDGSDNLRSDDRSRPFVILSGTTAALILLFGGVYYYEHVPKPASPSYTQLAWTNIGQQNTVAVGATGADLAFEVVSQQSAATRFRLSAEWVGHSSRPLAVPVTFTIGPGKTYLGALFVPAPADSCMYRVVLTMVAPGLTDPLTGRQRTWTLNAIIHKQGASIHKQGTSKNACLYSRAIRFHVAEWASYGRYGDTRRSTERYPATGQFG